MHCPQCDTEIDPSVSFCPECGADIDAARDDATGQVSESSRETTTDPSPHQTGGNSDTAESGNDRVVDDTPNDIDSNSVDAWTTGGNQTQNDDSKSTAQTSSTDPTASKSDESVFDPAQAGSGQPQSNPEPEPSPTHNPESTPDLEQESGQEPSPTQESGSAHGAGSPEKEPRAENRRGDDTGTETTNQTPRQDGTNTQTGSPQRDATRQPDQRTPAQNANAHAQQTEASGHGQSQDQRGGNHGTGQPGNQPSGRQRQPAQSQTQNRRPTNAPAPQPNQQATGFSWPTVTAAIYGAVAFAFSYGLIYAMQAIELSTKTNGFTASSDGSYISPLASMEQYEVAGWLFYSAHTTPIKFTSSGNDPVSGNVIEGVYGAFSAVAADGMSTDMQELGSAVFFGGLEAARESFTVTATGETASLLVPKLAYYAAPGIVALAAGYYLVRRVGAGRRLTDEQRVVSGALVGLAYAAIGVAAAATVFSATYGDGASAVTIKPQLEASAMLPLVAYPTVAAAVGGFFAG